MASGNTLRFVAYRNRSGEYWCLADNGLGQAENSSAHLYVYCKYDVSAQFQTKRERERERERKREMDVAQLAITVFSGAPYILQGRKITVG